MLTARDLFPRAEESPLDGLPLQGRVLLRVTPYLRRDEVDRMIANGSMAKHDDIDQAHGVAVYGW